MNPRRVVRLATWTVAIVALVVVATRAYGRGVHDEQLILAGWFYPTMSPVASVIAGVIISGIAALAIWLDGRRSPGTIRRASRGWVAIAIGGLWLGYAAGVGVTYARGAPVEYAGVVRYEFGAPIGAVAEVPGTCTSVVGDRTLLAEVTPQVGGLVKVFARSKATGNVYVQTSPASDGRPLDDYVLPGVPDRPASAMLPGLTFIHAYGFVAARHAELGFSDRLELQGRWLFESERLADDPWPVSFDMIVSWTCEPMT